MGKSFLLSAGPYTGMRDSLDPSTSSDPSKAFLLQNVCPVEQDKPTAFVGRPGCQQAGSQLGGAGARTGQLIYQFTKLSGTEYTVAIVGGKFYTFDWSSRAWTNVVTAANFTTAGITLSSTARCRAITIADKMLVTDGVNTPFLWDGTSGAGGLTKLTNCPVIYGQPTIYYAKNFVIKNVERRTIDWSEENDATTGYEAGGYNNSWTLGQTDQEALYAVRGSNEAIYYWRARSTGAISGAVTTTFKTDGTREGVSETVGTTSPDAIVDYENQFFFLDADGRPHVLIPGGGVKPIWQDLKETLTGLDTTLLSSAVGVFDPTLRLVLFGVAELGQSVPSAILVYNPVLQAPVAVWRGFTFNTFGIVKNASGTPLLMHLSSDGYAYDHGATLSSDALNAGTQAITHIVESPHLGVDTRVDKRFRRVDTLFRAASNLTGLSFSYTTPRGLSSSQSATVSGSQSAQWDVAQWDVNVWSSTNIEQHVSVGQNGLGRWIREKITHATASENFGFINQTVEAEAVTDSPRNP